MPSNDGQTAALGTTADAVGVGARASEAVCVCDANTDGVRVVVADNEPVWDGVFLPCRPRGPKTRRESSAIVEPTTMDTINRCISAMIKALKPAEVVWVEASKTCRGGKQIGGNLRQPQK